MRASPAFAVMPVLFAAVGTASGARACSPPPVVGSAVARADPSTALYLSAKADAVVLARIIGPKLAAGDSDTALATPTDFIKGKPPLGTIELPTAVFPRDARLRPRASDPQELREPNPDAYAGACVRALFEKGMTVLLFVKRNGAAAPVAIREPFSRDAEDVSGPASRWAKAVREYVAISAAPRSDWPARLQARAAVLRKRGGDPDAQAIATDLELEARRILLDIE